VAALAAVGVGVYLASQVWAQQGQPAGPAATPLRTRVALINMVEVLKKYEKFKTAEKVLREEVAQADKELEGYKARIAQLRTDFQKEADPAKRDQIEKDVKRLQLQAQDFQEEAQKRIGKKQGELAVQIYHEVEDAVKDFARYNDIELVLHYNDVGRTEPGDVAGFYSPGNVQRKMMMIGPVMPMYYDPRMDITAAVTQMLNNKLNAMGPRN
jgi:Skp family chaperone for outer membrane proteins